MQFSTAWYGTQVVQNVAEDVAIFRHELQHSASSNLSWGFEKIAEITVYGYAAAATITVWRWLNPPASRTEIRGRRYDPAWPTWYAPMQPGGNSLLGSGQSGAVAPSGSSAAPARLVASRVVAAKNSRKGGWRSNLEDNILGSKKFSTSSPTTVSGKK